MISGSLNRLGPGLESGGLDVDSDWTPPRINLIGW